MCFLVAGGLATGFLSDQPRDEPRPHDLALAPWKRIIYNASCASCGDGQTICFSLAHSLDVSAVRATPEIITDMVGANADALRASELKVLVERAAYPYAWYSLHRSLPVSETLLPSEMAPCTGPNQVSQRLHIQFLPASIKKLSSLACHDPDPRKSPNTVEEKKCVSLLLKGASGKDSTCVNIHKSTVAQLEAQEADRNACQKFFEEVVFKSAGMRRLLQIRDGVAISAAAGVYIYVYLAVLGRRAEEDEPEPELL